MARVSKNSGGSSGTRRDRPALTPEARENQLISKAINLAERQLDEGTASSQIIVHYLKLGTSKAELEKEKLRHETALLSAKTESLEAAKRVEGLYAEAIQAMRKYSGNGGEDHDYDY